MNKSRTASAGKRGKSVRSDCYIEIALKNRGGLKFDINSKVESMYGDSIQRFLNDLGNHFNLKNAYILLEDNGALPFTLAARFELALKRLFPDSTNEYLLPLNKRYLKQTSKERLRRSRLYLPGNEPKFYPNAGLHNPDGIILDLEDSVSPSEKDSARLLVRNALRSINFYGAERMVRINQLPKGLEDLSYAVPHGVDVILIPKSESSEQIKNVEREIEFLSEMHGITNPIFLMPIIESAKGVLNSYDIATASNRNCALAVGLEDYTADIGTQRTDEGKESYFARMMVVNAAKAAHIQAIDTVFSDVTDMDGLRKSVIEAKSIGFEGKGCIHPRQIKVVHEAFAPTETEIEKAIKIVSAFEDAERKGLGVVSLGSKMIDAPVVKRAQRVVELALLNNKLQPNWRDEE
jgi:citrate lyase subunit beta/citryl-CoA lyase